MSRILIICHQLPSPNVGATLPFYYVCKYLSTQHDVFLFYLQSNEVTSDVLNYTCESDFLQIPENTTIFQQCVSVIRRMIPYYAFRQRGDPFYNYYFYPLAARQIDAFIQEKSIELIITDAPMAFYVRSKNVPKIAYVLDAVSEFYLQNYKIAHNLQRKLLSLVQYLNFKTYEKTIYNDFDCCIVVTERDKKLLSDNVNIPIVVIPNGVDTDYFSPRDVPLKNNSMVFVGDMGTPPNVDAMMYFYKDIYTKIKGTVPSIQLIIVGRNPAKEIIELTKDPNIQVTGSVKDVRPYIASSTVVIAPMISGMGIKNKILEAMSMGKVVITTSIGCEGIPIRQCENGIITNDPEDFSEKIIYLLANPTFRKDIEKNARRTAVDKFSWDISMQYIRDIIERLLEQERARPSTSE